MKKLKLIGLYLLKHFRWSLLGICIIVFDCLPSDPVGPLIKGMAGMGFIWVAYSIVQFYDK